MSKTNISKISLIYPVIINLLFLYLKEKSLHKMSINGDGFKTNIDLKTTL